MGAHFCECPCHRDDSGCWECCDGGERVRRLLEAALAWKQAESRWEAGVVEALEAAIEPFER